MTSTRSLSAREGQFGRSAEVIGINRYGDQWVPYHTSITLRTDPNDPVKLLVIQGKHPLPHLFSHLNISVFINGVRTQAHVVSSSSFLLEIPVACTLPYCTAELHTRERFNPHETMGNGDHRDLGFVAEQVVPVSEREMASYLAWKQGSGRHE